ncbi:MAG: S8 family serine peptidase, partial [Gammaproteobacteria bacterium]|nr:S8 family serine peptidase [Gammaproteobacteria bacterium]
HVPEKFVKNRILLQPRSGLTQEKLDAIINQTGGRVSFLMEEIDLHILEMPENANIIAIAEALNNNPNIKFAELDGQLEPDLIPNDPEYDYGWHLPKIGAPNAWDSAQGDGIVIAILDTGVDTSHPDLQDRIVPGWNFYDGDDDVSDVHGHGTAIAGTAAASSNNNLGVASVSFQSRIMPMRISDTQGYGYYSLMSQAIISATDNGAKVANISYLGVSLSSSVDAAAQYMRDNGGVVVIAGGNTGNERNDPVSDAFIAVAATDTVDGQASFSSWGDYIDIAAPGIGIRTTKNGGSYGSVSGTSASSPIVAGVYALMMSANSSLQPAQLDSVLFDSALDLGGSGWDPNYGAGRVQADMAVMAAIGEPDTDLLSPTVAITSPNSGVIKGEVPVYTSASDNIEVSKVELYVNDQFYASESFEPFEFILNTVEYTDGMMELEARAYDASGNTGYSDIVNVTVSNDDSPPEVIIENPVDGSEVSGFVTVDVSATDNGNVAMISLTIDGEEVEVTYDSTTLSYKWNAKSPGGKGKGNGKKG